MARCMLANAVSLARIEIAYLRAAGLFVVCAAGPR